MMRTINEPVIGGYGPIGRVDAEALVHDDIVQFVHEGVMTKAAVLSYGETGDGGVIVTFESYYADADSRRIVRTFPKLYTFQLIKCGPDAKGTEAVA